MCGISGILKFDGQPVSIARINAATQAIQHRGPDNLSVWTNQSIGLGHTRLSIVDLSEGANQPFHSPDNRMSMVFNGEIYNYIELRDELKTKGYSFKTTSDMEVVIHGFSAWGNGLFSKLNGIFAIAFWDSHERKLTLVRDRLGVKPLYVCETDSELIFGSEIKTILAAAPERSNRLSMQALHEFLYYGVPLGGKSMLAGIDQVQPGHAVTWSADTKQKCNDSFWSYPTTQQRVGSDSEVISQTKFHLEQAVARQLTGDVPIGVFLSGGLDSSCITGFAARNYPGRLKTYSIAFDFAPSNELDLARQVAEMHGTDHAEIQIGGVGLADTVLKLIRCHDSPFSDAANIPLYLLCEQISGQLKVVLQGDGGDEVFGGYRRYASLAKARKYWMLAQCMRIPGVRNLIPWRQRRYLECFMPSQRYQRMARLLTLETTSDPPIQVLTDDIRQAVTRFDPFARYQEIEKGLSNLGDVQAMLATDMQIILPDTFLEKVDRSTMAHGVEVRVPLLENSLVDYVATLPDDFKVKGGEQKWLLKQAIKDVVPKSVLEGKKLGFGVPYSQWMRKPLRDFLHDQLATLSARGITKSNVTDKMRQSHVDGSEQYSFLLWKLLNLGAWLNEYKVELISNE